ncbi:MAG: putative toxin-antitoxin system toxin component, PIN family [Leptolyngbya sp.]|nr:putative toxin-antitoxin system toxin component, PIN family [Leptolyngbya sp.]
MRVVIDTNIWVSGLLWGGLPNQVLQQVRQGAVQAIITAPMLTELARTLAYPKLQPKIQHMQETPDGLLLAVQELTQSCIPVPLRVPTLRDTNDLVVLEAAVGGNAGDIITGDRDLLVLGEFSGIPILSPKDFLQRYFPAQP